MLSLHMEFTDYLCKDTKVVVLMAGKVPLFVLLLQANYCPEVIPFYDTYCFKCSFSYF